MAPTQDRFSDQLVALHEKAISFTGMLDTVAIGVPGPVAGNTMGHSGPLGLAGSFSFSDCFPDAQHLIVRNDVYIALIAEIRAGAGRRFQNFVLVSTSTGTGVGVTISGQPLDIRTEMGHQKFWMDIVSERPCISHSGCWESICSGAALADADRACSAQEVRKANIYAFANLALAYDPSAIAVMGGVALNRYDELIPDQTDLAHHVISKPTPQILKSELGPQIGVYGVMKLAEEHIKLTLRHKS